MPRSMQTHHQGNLILIIQNYIRKMQVWKRGASKAKIGRGRELQLSHQLPLATNSLI